MSERPDGARRWWSLTLHQFVTIIGSVFFSVVVATLAWGALSGRVTSHDEQIAATKQRLDQLSADIVRGREIDSATATTLAVIAEQMKQANDRLDKLDRQLERIELRQLGITVPADDSPRGRHQ